jgi:hypothetical protein
MHDRTACSDHDPVELVLLDILTDHFLSRIGTHILIGPYQLYIGDSGYKPGYGLHINDLGNIGTAHANVYTYSGIFHDLNYYLMATG